MEQAGKMIVHVIIALIIFKFIEHHWKRSGKGDHYDPSLQNTYDPSMTGA